MATTSTRHAGAWWLATMGLFLIFAGSFFAWRLWLSYEKTSISRSWVATPCLIDSSRVVSDHVTPASPLTHRVEIAYQYEFGGQTWHSNRIKHVESAPSGHYDDVLALQRDYPPGSQCTCFVNPAAPAESVLRQGTRAALYSIWFPLLFVIGGAGMIFGLFRRPRPSSPS